MLPAKEVGSDFRGFFFLDDEQKKTAPVIADVSGKSETSAMCFRGEQMLEQKRQKVIICGACLLFVSFFLFAYYQREYLNEIPLTTIHIFEQPSFAVTDDAGTLLVIEQSKTCVSILNNGEVTSVIYGGKENTDGFYYAEYVASDGEYVYIADVKYVEGSLAVETERITRYTHDGRFDSVLFEVSYDDDKPLQYGNIRDLQAQNGRLTFIVKSDKFLELYALENAVPILIRKVNTDKAEDIRNIHYNQNLDKIYAMTLRGELFCETDGELHFYQAWSSDSSQNVPWEIASDNSGQIYLTDLGTRSVVKLPDYNIVYKSDYIVYRLTINENNVLSLTDNTSVFQMQTDGAGLIQITESSYDTGYFIMRAAVWATVILLAVFIAVILMRLIIRLFRGNQLQSFKFLALVVISTVLTAIIVTVNIMSNNIGKDSEKNRINLTQLCTAISGLSGDTFGDDLSDIHLLGDYKSEAYMRVRSYLDPICLNAAEQGSNLYYLLYKYEGNTLYGVMDYEDTFGTVYPMYDLEGSGYDEVANGTSPYLFEISSDSYGEWMFVAAPVFDSDGEIVGLIEIGTDLYGETLKRNQQITNIIVSTSVLLVLFLLIFSEVIAASENVAENALIKDSRCSGMLELIRPLIFLAFLADNTGTAFIPQLSANIFAHSGLTFASTLGAAFPISLKMLFVAIAALTGSALINKFGIKIVLAIGVAIQMAGLSLTGLAVFQNNYLLLLAAETIAGSGLGLIIVSGNILPTYSNNEERRNNLFAGVNVGITSGVVVGASIGSYAAATAGYAVTFIISSAFLIPSLVMSFLCAPNICERAILKTSDANDKLSVISFLRRKNVFSFLLLLMLPLLVILSFKDYVFPLFASENGYSDIAIGQALLFSGALALFVAPAASDKLLKRFGALGTNLFSGTLFSIALVLFAIIPTWQNSVFVLFILNFAGCFGLVAQGVFFSSMRDVKKFGVERAMGIFSLFDNLAQTAGPLLFGSLLIFGVRVACLAIGIMSFVFLLAFILSNSSVKIKGGVIKLTNHEYKQSKDNNNE